MTTSSHINRIRRRAAAQEGMAMVMAVIVTLILITLVGGAVAVATQGSGATTRDNNTKAADEAVEAGLRVALYRLNMIQPSTSNCINNNASISPTGDGTCHDTTETLNSGATFTYYDTPALSSGSSCVGYYLQNSAGLTQRCVTVSATANGVTRRAQIRIASYAATPLFPAAGLIGLKEVDVLNNADSNGSVASNGLISMSNNSVVNINGSNALELGPSGTFSGSKATYPTPILQRTPSQGPFTLSPVDPGNSATINDDGRITNYLSSPQQTPYDQSSGCTMGTSSGSCWNPTARTLSLPNNSSLTLGGGVYNFCSLNLSNNSTLTIANGARVAIYIDSASRSGSSCPSTKIANGGGNGFAGWFHINNNSSIVNPSQDPTALIIYIYDNTGATNNGVSYFENSNNTAFYGTIYAPQSVVDLKNNAGLYGAVAANQIILDQNATFAWDQRDSSLQATTAGIYFRTAWRECQPTQPSSNDPQSGC